MDNADSILGTGSQQQTQQVDQVLNKLQPQLQLLTVVGVVLTIIVVVVMLFNNLYKWRVERAILNIDKNLEKLVKAQVSAEAEQPDSSNAEQSEQI